MKTELKTLKDFREDTEPLCEEDLSYATNRDGVIENRLLDNLKQEAIKWAKHYKQKSIDAIDVAHPRDTNGSKMFVLMEFFNITEEDLK